MQLPRAQIQNRGGKGTQNKKYELIGKPKL